MEKKELSKKERKDKIRELIRQIVEVKNENVNKWKRLKELQLQLIELAPDNLRSLFDLVKIAKKQNNWRDVKRWQTRVLELLPDNIFSMYDLITVAQIEKDWEEMERITRRILELSPDNETATKLLKIAIGKQNAIRRAEERKKRKEQIALSEDDKPFVRVKNKELELENRIKVGNKRISDVRKQLYSGEIEMSQLQELSDEFKGSFEGRLLIAEMCTYFEQPRLALQALKDYQTEHRDDMLEREEKIMKRAIEIVRSKQRIKDDLKWASVYSKQNTQDKGIEK